ncbi:MAG: helix-turn-helix transcriptional regulator [Lentisphaeria bacterium]|nr:helix-turn-helix transcriptional regulator [Lentisphaeria bacterium]
MKKIITQVVQWAGERVPYELMRPGLCNMLSDVRRKRLHYAVFMPGTILYRDRSFSIRICCYGGGVENLTLKAAFDGVVSKRSFSENDIFVGSANAHSSVIGINNVSYCGFSLIFHLQFIRLNYAVLEKGKLVKNIYCHSPHPAGTALRQMVNSLESIIHDHKCRDERCRPLLEAIIAQVIYEFDEGSSKDLHHYDPLALRIKDYLDSCFQHDIDCSGVCEILRINRSYGSTVFKKNFNMTMKDYLLGLRLSAAKHLLEGQNGLSINEISQLCAFNNAGYFIKVFRAWSGMTPGEFRKKNQSK